MLYLAQGAPRAAAPTPGYLARVPALASLDRISYRLHAFAFPVWTFAVLVTGPIWAHEAWARYWNWDPKEVWAFITWVVYAAYLHARTTAGWKGRGRRTSRWSARRRCGSTSSGSTTSRRPASTPTPRVLRSVSISRVSAADSGQVSVSS